MKNYTSNELRAIANDQWVEGAGRMRDMAEAYIEEREDAWTRYSASLQENDKLRKEVEQLKQRLTMAETARRQYKEASFALRYGACTTKAASKLLPKIEIDYNRAELTMAALMAEKVSVAPIAKADHVVVLHLQPKGSKAKYPVTVEVVKNRYGAPSGHGFTTVENALDWIEEEYCG